MGEDKGNKGLRENFQTSEEMTSQSKSCVGGGAALEVGGREEMFTRATLPLLLLTPPGRMLAVTSFTIKSKENYWSWCMPHD